MNTPSAEKLLEIYRPMVASRYTDHLQSAAAQRGEKTLAVSTVAGLTVGQYVELADHMRLVECLSGPGQPPAPPAPECVDACLAAFDFDDDQFISFDGPGNVFSRC